MRHSLIIVMVAGCLAIPGAGGSIGQERRPGERQGERRGGPGGERPDFEELRKRFDRDGDGGPDNALEIDVKVASDAAAGFYQIRMSLDPV